MRINTNSKQSVRGGILLVF